ncbi:hypothetical protein [Dubosiella newyorkensis]|nr:hypothetical protein [Dubosiella newyorkensis]
MHILIGARRDPIKLRLIPIAHEIVPTAFLDEDRSDSIGKALQHIE